MAKKVALLIGVSEYGQGLTPLHGAVKDVEAMQQVLQHQEMGNFDEVMSLLNPDPLAMMEAIESLFSGRAKDDLVLLFFSGHGIKDENFKLYFATGITRKSQTGELVKATAVPASFIHDMMNNSRSKQQVVILDCCFSGAFARGLSAKDDGSVTIKAILGGEGGAVLTSSTSTQLSFEQQGGDLSVYTRYLVEGIETGAADIDNDGVVSVNELHDYAKQKVQEAAPAMRPEIYTIKEGYKIRLAQAPTDNPKLKYRREVERYKSQGEISFVRRSILDELRDSLQLSPEDTEVIEMEVLKPYREYREKLQRYETVLSEALQRENPLRDNTRDDLKRLQQILGLRKEDVEPIEERILGNTSEREASDRLSPIQQTLTSQPQTVLPELNASIDISARPPGAQQGTQANDLRSASTLRKLLLLVIGVGITTTVTIATFKWGTPKLTSSESSSSNLTDIDILTQKPLTQEKCKRLRELYLHTNELYNRIPLEDGDIRIECKQKWNVVIPTG
ncbi:caspase family protein [Scytonema hofmannii]|nr:caspase family protein [Scytonema hofmannii]